MHARKIAAAPLGLLLAALAAAPALEAQTSAAHTHMGHVAQSFRATPDAQGLLPTAVAEAEIAAQHAGFAESDPTNLDGMQRHMAHVIHALDPSVVENGPGLGFGVKAAAAGVSRHIEMAGADESASDNVKTHATHVATAASNVPGWVDRAVSLAREIEGVSDAETATELVHELIDVLDAISSGTDADGDGRVGWQEGEGGLAQATQHMNLMMRGEGLGG